MDIASCQQAGVDDGKAQATIIELRLDANRLRGLRKPVLNKLNDQLLDMITAGYSVEEAKMRLTRAVLKKDKYNHWPAFFSAIRDYLGEAAEQQLKDIGYNG